MDRLTLTSGLVNRYGYRVLPEGGKLEYYHNNPTLLWNHDGHKLPIGRIEDIRLEDGKLTALPAFDEDDEFAMKCKQKYENKFLNACSIYHNPISVSDDPQLMVQGQTRATVTEWELLEVSLVNTPGDAGSTRLNLAPGKTLDDVIPMVTKLNANNMDNKNSIPAEITQVLQLSADASITDAVNAITSLKDETKNALSAKVDLLIDNGKELGVVNDQNEDRYRKLAMKDFENTSELLKLSVRKDEGGEAGGEKTETLKGVLEQNRKLSKNKGAAAEEEEKETFAYLSLHNPKKLNKIRMDDPERYNKLAAEYKPEPAK
jgi:hypothetical protein